MKKIGLILISLVMLLSVVVGTLGCSEKKAEVTWDLATYTAVGSTLSNVMDDFAERVHDKTDGKMEINVFHGGTLASGVEIFDGVSNGSIEMGSSPVSYYMTKFMLTGLALSPCWAWDTELGLKARKAIVEEWEPAVKQFADNNIMPILWLASGFVELAFADEVTTNPDDAAGHTIATADSRTLAAMATGLGCLSNNDDNKNLVTNASQGVIDAAFSPLDMYESLGLSAYLPYVVMTQFFPTVYSSIMNVDAFNELDADMQDAVLEAADEAEAAGIIQAQADLDELITKLQADSDVTLTILNPTQQVAWWADMGPAMYDGIKGGMDYGASKGVTGAYPGAFDEVMAIAEDAMGQDSPFHDYTFPMNPS